MKAFKIWTFLSALVLIGILAVFSAIASMAYSDGGFSIEGVNDLLIFALSKLFWAFCFPFAFLTWTFAKNSEQFLIFAVIADCLLYAFLIERLLYLRRRKKLNTPLH